MAFSITCPSCSAKLKTATAIPAGRSVQCPKCKESFAVSSENMVEVADSKFGGANPAGKSGATAAAKTAAPPPKKASAPENAFSGLDESTPRKGRRDDNDEDEAPRSRKRRDDAEDEDNRPRKKRQDDDTEDEAPRSRKRRDDDEDADDRPRKKRRDDEEEEEAPRSRKRRDDEDEDERPRKKRRDDEEEEEAPRSRKRRDDDEDEDRPSRRHRDDDDDDDRPRKKKKKKKTSGLGLKIGIAVGGLAAVGVIVFLLIWLLGGGGYDSEMVALMPSDVHSLEFANIEKINDNARTKKIAEKTFNNNASYALLKTAGLSVGDIKSKLEGRTEKFDSVMVIRLKKSFDKAKITSGSSEAKASDKSYWKKKSDVGEVFVMFPSDSLIVIVSKEETMKSILNKEAGKVVIPESLQDLAKRVSSGDIWTAHVNKGASSLAGNQATKEQKARSGGTGPTSQDVPHVDLATDGQKAGSGETGRAKKIELGGSSVSVTDYFLRSSSEDAKKFVEREKNAKDDTLKAIDAGGKTNVKITDAQKEALKRMFKNANISASGDTVEATATLDLAPFDGTEGILEIIVHF